MNQSKDFTLNQLAAYETVINIDLFNAAAQLAVSTTEATKQVSDLLACLGKSIWYKKVNAVKYFEPHGIRYFGELLERYSERLGDTPQNLRAVALAFACTKAGHTDNMFVGSQRAEFLKRLSKVSDEDIYCLCARYLIADNSSRGELESALLNRSYSQTEELVFALYALMDHPNAWDILRPQTLRLLFAERTLTVEGNSGIFVWVLDTYRDRIRACRKADNAPLRSMLKLTENYVRSHHREHAVLLNSGYTAWELLYLNSCFLWDKRLWNKMIYSSSIPAEKLCADYITETVNDACLHSQNTREYVYWLIHDRYKNLEIKIDGCQSIWQMVSPSVSITSPEVMAWMCKDLHPDYRYCFDVLDEKWDVLASLLNSKEYHNLFRSQLLANRNASPDAIASMLARYEVMTGASYLDVFSEYQYDEQEVFCLLVGCGQINLWTHFECSQGKYTMENPIRYMWQMIDGVRSKEAFGFWQQFFKTHTVHEIDKYWPGRSFHESFRKHSNYGYNTYRVEALRTFLSPEENRQVIEWLDESMYRLNAGRYDAFVSDFLCSEDTYKLFSPEELRPVFDRMLTLHPDQSDLRSMKKKFMSEAELLADKQAAEQRRAEQEAREREALEQKLRNETDEAFTGSLGSLVNHISRQGDWRDQRRIVLSYIKERLPDLLNTLLPLSNAEAGSFMFICGWMIRYNLMTVSDALNMIASATTADESPKEVEIAC